MTPDQDADSKPEKNGLFDATHWSVVLRAKDKSDTALGSLCQSYRQPLFVWLRSQGYSQHDADDLVQGYFAHLLSRDFLANVAKEKGQFRTFLLRCLKNYLRDLHQKNTAEKRGGTQKLESLDETNDDGQLLHDPAHPGDSPDKDYDRAYAQAVVNNAFHSLEVECSKSGHLALCKELQPVFFADETAGSYQEIATRLGMTAGAVATAKHRMRTRLSALIREEVLQTVSNPDDLESELKYLMGQSST